MPNKIAPTLASSCLTHIGTSAVSPPVTAGDITRSLDAFVRIPLNLAARQLSALAAPQPTAATPESTFELLAFCDPAAPSSAARDAARALMSLATEHSEGLKAYYFKHPDSGLRLGSQLPAGDKPMSHRDIARSFADKAQPRAVQQALTQAAVFPAKSTSVEHTWGGTRLVADCSVSARPGVVRLRVSPSIQFGHPANDAGINDAIATFYTNVCIFSGQQVTVSAQDPACEHIARRMRVKLRAHFDRAKVKPLLSKAGAIG